jgi:hypothetical protein
MSLHSVGVTKEKVGSALGSNSLNGRTSGEQYDWSLPPIM